LPLRTTFASSRIFVYLIENLLDLSLVALRHALASANFPEHSKGEYDAPSNTYRSCLSVGFTVHSATFYPLLEIIAALLI
jgi:hypothetical protein